MGLGEEDKMSALIEDAMDEAEEIILLEHIAKLEAQNKKLVEALKEIKAEKKDTCSVCNAAYFIPEIAEDALKEMGIE